MRKLILRPDKMRLVRIRVDLPDFLMRNNQPMILCSDGRSAVLGRILGAPFRRLEVDVPEIGLDFCFFPDARVVVPGVRAAYRHAFIYLAVERFESIVAPLKLGAR